MSGNRDEIERLLGSARKLLEEAESLLGDAVLGQAEVVPASAQWRARAGPLFGRLNARFSKLVGSLDGEFARVADKEREDLIATHARVLRQLERQEREVAHPAGSPLGEELRLAVLDEAERLEEVFLAFEKQPDAARLKILEFDGKVELSALERRAGNLMRQLDPHEKHELKMLMKQLREFFKEAHVDLARLLKGEPPVSARRKFRVTGYVKIPAGVIQGSRPFPKDPTGKSGLFYHSHPNGQLRLLARLRDGQVQRWLFLFLGVSEGQYRTPHEVEHYNSDGTVEVCGALYQSEPRASGLSFQAWAMARAAEV